MADPVSGHHRHSRDHRICRGSVPGRPLVELNAFFPSLDAIVFVTDLITSALLFARFSIFEAPLEKAKPRQNTRRGFFRAALGDRGRSGTRHYEFYIGAPERDARFKLCPGGTGGD